MTNVVIRTNHAAAPAGPYNQAIVASGQLVFVAGQIAIDPATNQPVGAGDAAQQTHQAIANLKAILEASGATLQDVVRTTVFLANMQDYATVNEVYSSYFPSASAPARVCLQVARLPMDMLVEIDCIAVINPV
jgi:2-iminobutanoate/2-iminopropanoate deaminase